MRICISGSNYFNAQQALSNFGSSKCSSKTPSRFTVEPRQDVSPSVESVVGSTVPTSSSSSVLAASSNAVVAAAAEDVSEVELGVSYGEQPEQNHDQETTHPGRRVYVDLS